MSTRKMLGASLIALAASSGIAFATPALPSGGAFTTGSGQISTSGSTETVTITPGALTPGSPVAINWAGGYDVAAGKTVTYAAGSGSGTLPSVVVNNDTSSAASTIDGTINSPGFTQVIVNPDGISVGPNAVLPGSVALAAGTYDSSTGQVTASTAPVTIAPGVTYGAYGAVLGGPQFASASVTVDATTGDTLPDTHGTAAAIDVPAQVTNGATQKFSLYKNQELTGEFFSGSSTPAPVSIDGGSKNGVTVSSISVSSTNGGDITVEHVAASGGIVVGANANGFNIASNGTTTAGDLTAAGASAAGGVTISEQGPVTIDGNLTATGKDGSVLITTSGGDAYVPPGQTGSGSTVTIDPNLSMLASDGQVDISGNIVSLPASLNISGTSFQIYSNQPLAGLNGSSVINVTQKGGQYASYTPQLAAPSISGLTINDSGLNSYQFQVEANTVTDSVFNVPMISFNSAGYESSPNFYDGATLTLKNIKLTNIGGTGAPSFLTVAGTDTSVDMSNVTESQPAQDQATNFDIKGTPDITLSGSTLFGTGLIGAGKSTLAGGIPTSGNITIDNTTITNTVPGSDQIVAADGGTVNIGAGSKISINQGGSCDTSGLPCDTYISAKNVGFSTGNSETASGSNLVTGSANGTANANPGETSIAASQFSSGGNSIQILTSLNGSQNAGTVGTINVAGTLDAGHPAVVTPPVVTPPVSNGGGKTTAPPVSNGGGSNNSGGKTTAPPANNGGGKTTAPPVSNGGGKTTTPPSNNGGGKTTAPSVSNGGGKTTTPPSNNSGGKTTVTKPTIPQAATKIVTVAPVQIAPSSSITSIQQRGSTVLVPETPGSNAAPVSVSQPSAGQVGTPSARKQLR
ncbi:hypothetical protein [Acidiphilium sp. PM]|uniref:beta strand repeat-containing protein n=1 Tax=Acidiphilium sp. PM TaxID=1043206 RepID=UPI000214514C|nr:hypothetical protein [Acidiphilium sp. PM]EGO94275.1 Penicillin-binding protein, 1A [Acidiphilium sp. PM]